MGRSSIFGGAFLAICALSASSLSAQHVGMAGEYSESNGIIIHFPQNPPNVACAADANAWNAQDNARCARVNQKFFGQSAFGNQFVYPHHGAYGARLGTALTSELPAPQQNGSAPAGMNVGDPFRLPPQLMHQRLGQQVGIVLNNAVRQIDTTFTAVAPGPARSKLPPTDTRVFNAGGWVGQNNGLPSPSNVTRAAANTIVTHMAGLETVTVTYTPGPNAFGGTMAVLLDGRGRLYIERAYIDTLTFTLFPMIATNPLGDSVAGFEEKNGAGWDYTVMSTQHAGRGKAFGLYPTSVINQVVAPRCEMTPPPTPAGCNEINYWETSLPGVSPTPNATLPGPGINLGFLIPSAMSTRHMFALTTGTVMLHRIGMRSFGTLEDTATARGYDTTSAGERNVGLVAGSFSERNSVAGIQINHQIIGVDLSFTPEPGTTVALMCGAGLLGAMATRRGARGR